MSAVEELAQLLTLDQAQRLVADPSGPADAVSTQQLLDDLLGCFDEDDSLLSLTNSHTLDS